MPPDIEPLRFSYEGDLIHAVRRKIGQVPLLNYSESRQLLEARRRDLLGDAVRVTLDLMPEIHALWQKCLNQAGSGLSGDLFVRQSSEYNANVFAHEKTFDLMVHSSLINDFTPDELCFVFGHELGHVIFQHSIFPVYHLVEQIQDKDPEAAEILLCWSRASEISADRVGMLCCGRLDAATTALFRTASGLADIDANRALRSLRSQYEELERHIKSVETAPLWIRTHPMIPIRFKALELAALDLIALSRGTGGFSVKGFQRIDQQIAFILQALDVG